MFLQANAIKVQKRLMNRPRKPVQVAADVVERVLATRGDTYLDTREQDLSWLQLSLTDVKLALATDTMLAAAVISCTFWLLLRLLQVLAYRILGRNSSNKAKIA